MRDVSTLVKPAQVIDTEHLTTLFVIISKFSLKEWEEGYEKMCNFVVGRDGRRTGLRCGLASVGLAEAPGILAYAAML